MTYNATETAESHEGDNYTTDWHEEYNFIKDCHNQESKFEGRLPWGYSCCGQPQYTWEQFAKQLFLLFKTAVLERCLPQ
jgi:hypothetical protein